MISAPSVRTVQRARETSAEWSLRQPPRLGLRTCLGRMAREGAYPCQVVREVRDDAVHVIVNNSVEGRRDGHHWTLIPGRDRVIDRRV